MAKNRENVKKGQEEEDFFKVPDNYTGPDFDITEENTTPETWEKLGGDKLKDED